MGHDYLMQLLGEVRRLRETRSLRENIYAMYEAIVVDLIREQGEELDHVWGLIEREASKTPWKSRLALSLAIGLRAKRPLSLHVNPSGQLGWTFLQEPKAAEMPGDPTPAAPIAFEDEASGQYRFQWIVDLVSGAGLPDGMTDQTKPVQYRSSPPARSSPPGGTSRPETAESQDRERFLEYLEELLHGRGPVPFEWRDYGDEVRLSRLRLLFLLRMYRELRAIGRAAG